MTLADIVLLCLVTESYTQQMSYVKIAQNEKKGEGRSRKREVAFFSLTGMLGER